MQDQAIRVSPDLHPFRRAQVHYSLTGEGSPQEPRPVSLLGLDSGIYFRHVCCYITEHCFSRSTANSSCLFCWMCPASSGEVAHQGQSTAP